MNTFKMLVLLMVWVPAREGGGTEIEDLPHLGVRFQHKGELALVSSFHSAVIDVDFRTITGNLGVIKRELQQIRKVLAEKQTSTSATLFLTTILEHVELINSKAMDLINVEQFRKLDRRGLINAYGAINHFLFGLADSETIEKINERIDNIERNSKNIIQEVNKDVTIIHKMSEEMLVLNNATSRILMEVQTLDAKLKVQELINYALWLSGNINALAILLNNIDIGLQKMHQGRIAPEIVSGKALDRILNKLENEGYPLLFENSDQLVKYSDLSLIFQIKSPRNTILRFLIMLPLKNMEIKLHLLQIIPIPMYNKTLNLGVIYETEHPYIGVSEDMQLFAPIKDLSSCRHNSNDFVCPAGATVYTKDSENCEVELYTKGHTIVDSCPRNIYKLSSPRFIRTETGFVFTSPIPITLSIICNSKKPDPKLVAIEGTGFLKLNGGCFASGHGIRLASPNMTRDENNAEYKIVSETKLSIPLLSDHELNSLHEIKDIIHEKLLPKGKRLEVNHLIKNLKRLKWENFTSKFDYYNRPITVIMTIIGLLMLVVSLRLLWLNKFKVLRAVCNCFVRSRARPSMPVISAVEENQELRLLRPLAGHRPRIRAIRN